MIRASLEHLQAEFPEELGFIEKKDFAGHSLRRGGLNHGRRSGNGRFMAKMQSTRGNVPPSTSETPSCYPKSSSTWQASTPRVRTDWWWFPEEGSRPRASPSSPGCALVECGLYSRLARLNRQSEEVVARVYVLKLQHTCASRSPPTPKALNR